ncbi:MAG: hypothetical protein HKN34_04150 [Gammaproteobacteria bacterium]|nr:hypothetical protein [Gammaproteobacteria bacterium]
MSESVLPDLPDEGDVRKRQGIVIAIILVVIIIVLGYAFLTNPATQMNQQSHEQGKTIDYTTPGATNNAIQNWVLQNENQLKAFNEQRDRERADYKAEREANDKRFQALMQEINRLKQDIAINTEGTGDNNLNANNSMLPDIPLPPRESLPVANQPSQLAMPDQSTGTIDQSGQKLMNTLTMTPEASSRIVKISFTKKNKTKKPHIRDTIPAGSFGKAVMLSGLDAPTGGLAERNPHPVLLELIDNASLPNRYRHRVKQCRVVASGTGNISDERAYLRLERLTCVLKNGDIISEVATGTVTGEDGKNGLRGNLVTKQGALIANAFWAGALSGMGDAIASSYATVATSATGTVSSVDPSKVTETGLASGVSNSMERIAEWYFKRAEETYPIIEVSAGRIVNLFLTEDLALNANLLAKHTPESIDE